MYVYIYIYVYIICCSYLTFVYFCMFFAEDTCNVISTSRWDAQSWRCPHAQT